MIETNPKRPQETWTCDLGGLVPNKLTLTLEKENDELIFFTRLNAQGGIRIQLPNLKKNGETKEGTTIEGKYERTDIKYSSKINFTSLNAQGTLWQGSPTGLAASYTWTVTREIR